MEPFEAARKAVAKSNSESSAAFIAKQYMLRSGGSLEQIQQAERVARTFFHGLPEDSPAIDGAKTVMPPEPVESVPEVLQAEVVAEAVPEVETEVVPAEVVEPIEPAPVEAVPVEAEVIESKEAANAEAETKVQAKPQAAKKQDRPSDGTGS